MPSADFCLLTLCVAIQGASGMAVITLTPALTHGRQISPDSVQYPLEGYKNVNFPCTTAAFTLSPEPMGFVVSCPLARRLSPGTRLRVMRFLFPGSSPGQAWSAGYPRASDALGLPPDPSSRIRPCLRLVLLVASLV